MRSPSDLQGLSSSSGTSMTYFMSNSSVFSTYTRSLLSINFLTSLLSLINTPMIPASLLRKHPSSTSLALLTRAPLSLKTIATSLFELLQATSNAVQPYRFLTSKDIPGHASSRAPTRALAARACCRASKWSRVSPSCRG